jgi:polysaccharide pyruvyl transferase WcaK-like protein
VHGIVQGKICHVRYFLYGYYGYGNFGDDVLLRAMVDGICANDTDARFLVHNLDPAPGYGSDPRVRFTHLARYLANIRRRPWRLATYLVRLVHCLGKSDVLVIGGGTLFIDKGRFNLSLALLHCAVLIAKLMRMPVIVAGVGVDRLTHPLGRRLTRAILGAADFVAVREARALPYAAHRRPDRTKLAGDLALALDIGTIASPLRLRRRVGLCFIDYFRTTEPSAADHTAYEAAILRLIRGHRDSHDFVCITFQRGIGQRDDWLVPILRALLRHPDHACRQLRYGTRPGMRGRRRDNDAFSSRSILRDVGQAGHRHRSRAKNGVAGRGFRLSRD